MPTSGIVICHRDWLPIVRPTENLLLVNLKADRRSHPYAQLEIVQTLDEIDAPSAWRQSHVIRHWPQPGLIPRLEIRGDWFEHAAFFGYPEQLAPQLRSATWSSCIRSLDMRWSIVPIDKWHDFSDVDVVVAARSFDGVVTANRPASKLYNAWLAGVPAILGPEAAFRRERRSELDYLEITSLAEAAGSLRLLKEDVALRRRMVDNGLQRSLEFHPARIAAEWEQFLTQIAQPALRRWRGASSTQRRLHLVGRDIWRVRNKLHRGYLKMTKPGQRR